MRKRMKQAITGLLLAVFLFTVPAQGAQAAERQAALQKVNYKSLYKAFLQSGRVRTNVGYVDADYYYVLNLNKKGAPELIVTPALPLGAGIVYYVYTIKKGAVVYSGVCSMRGVSSAVLQVSRKHKGIYITDWINGIGGTTEALYGMSGTKLVRKQHAMKATSPTKEFYYGKKDSANKKVSKKSYKKFCKKYFAKLKKYNMIENTAANREKSFR